MEISQKLEALIDGLVGKISVIWLGGVSAAVANAFLNPLQVIRIRLSAYKNQKEDSESASEEVKKDKEKSKFSSLEIIRRMIEEEGIGSLFKGLVSNCFGIFYAFALYFFFYRLFQRFFLSFLKTTQLGAKYISISTFLAGGISCTLSEPIWKVNARIVHSKEKVWKIIERIYKEEGGLKAFFTGLIPAYVLLVNPIINYTFYEELKNLLAKDQSNPKGLSIIIAALVSKAAATFVTYPMLAIKSRLMANASDGKKGIIGTILQMWKEGRTGAFYRGFFAKFGHSLCYYAFMMLAYEKVRRILKGVFLGLLR